MPRLRPNPFTTIRTEGALLPPELLQRVAEEDKDLKGLRPTDYHLGEGERLREAISRSWNRLAGVWASFEAQVEAFSPEDPGTGATREKWLGPMFSELGFGRLEPAKAEEIEGRSYPISHKWREVPIHLVGAGLDLDRKTPGAKGAARASPHSLVQEYLNRSGALWGLVSNGRTLRLLRDNVSLTRQAFVEFDLRSMFSGEAYSDFAVLWLVCHQSQFEAERPEESYLEQWAQAAEQQGTRALETLRSGVERAITEMGKGFLAHPANTALRDRLFSGGLAGAEYYRQLLRVAYRLIFLFVAEDRDVLHPPAGSEEARRRYREFYSTSRLRSLAERRRGTKHADLNEAFSLVVRKLGDDAGCPELALAPLGSFLWSPEATPDLEGAQLSNRSLLEAVRALAFTEQGKVLRAIDYRNMGSEELGSIYESLLELHPTVHRETATFELTVAAGNERKTTGSYYTPTSLINALLDSALDPVLAEAAAKDDPERAVLELTVLDPACGSGHFLVAAAHRIAKRLAAIRTGDEEPSPEAYRAALRDVVSRCLYGIDINPMAVELCKVSLWMEAMEPGKPLSFLEHHIVCGNALLGTTPKLLEQGIPDEAFKALEGDDRKVVAELRRRNKQEREGQEVLFAGPSVAELTKPLAEAVEAIEAEGAEAIEDVRRKEREWRALEGSEAAAHAKLVADAWCAAFVMEKKQGGPVITDGVLSLLAKDPRGGDPQLKDAIRLIAANYQFLHPHVAFPAVVRVPDSPEVVSEADAAWSRGFSVVLSNPPWERVKLQEKEWFAAIRPDIAAARNAAQRKQMIKGLMDDDPLLYARWIRALHKADGESHLLRDAGRYPLTGRGDVNTYAVFSELMRTLIDPAGRVGAILPTGIATDDTTKFFFGSLVETRSLVSIFSFENEEFIFPAIHHATRFCLLTMAGPERSVPEAEFVFFARQPSQIHEGGRRFTLSPEDFDLVNPNTRTCPVFRSGKDAELTKAIYRRVPVFVRNRPPQENRWDLSFLRMFDMANDSGLFRQRAQLEIDGWILQGNTFRRGEEVYLPLYEAKMIHVFDHRFGTYQGQTEAQARQGKLPELDDNQHSDPACVPLPRYWVAAHRVTGQLADRWDRDWFLGWRDITGATVLRTVIPTVLPRVAVGHSMPLALVNARPSAVACLLANLSSFAFDYVARQKLGGTHLTFFILEQLPVLDPQTFQQPVRWERQELLESWIARRVLELTFTALDIQAWAKDLGWTGPPFTWNSQRRRSIRAELDAAFFHLYGLDEHDVRHVMNSFPIMRERDEKAFGDYRTERLVLESYTAMRPHDQVKEARASD